MVGNYEETEWNLIFQSVAAPEIPTLLKKIPEEKKHSNGKSSSSSSSSDSENEMIIIIEGNLGVKKS